MDESSQRVTAHGVSIDLIARQADSIGLPLLSVKLPRNPSNKVYLERFEQVLAKIEANTATLAFGDIFLQDLRDWRERSMSAMGFSSLFPLWRVPSRELCDEFLTRRFAAVICCVNGAHLDRTYLGRLYDARLLEALSTEVDCCGENGEFHTFAFDGPIFRYPIRYVIGTTSYEPITGGSPVKGHWFCELLPTETRPNKCPLCGANNDCGMAAGRQSCWCFFARISDEVQDRIPPYARDITCVCRECATESRHIR
jgi:uncharacterized protein (TIGR00290 family)